MLVGFAAVEDRAFHGDDADIGTAKDDAARDVRRIEDVMRDRRERILGARRTVHERDWPKRRLADWSADERETASTPERHAPRRRQLHEEIVRVLVIGDLQALIGFADLKDLRVATTGGRQRLERDHPVEPEGSRSKRAGCVRHQPVLRAEFRLAAMAALVVEGPEQHAVPRERPRVGRRRALSVRLLLIGRSFRLRNRGKQKEEERSATSCQLFVR